ncbi:MAG: 3'(2'),5'-bisphosphate nucleotidase CysQ [Bacteroidota bacterium]
MNRTELMHLAVEAAIAAGVEILKVYEEGSFEVEQKGDNSPLTRADIASNTIINAHLKNTDIPIISEENKEIEYQDRETWSTCWIVDPLDGTKEFIKRNGEFTVNIALVSNGLPEMGVIYVPVTRELYFADTTTAEARKIVLDADHNFDGNLLRPENKIAPSLATNGSVRVVGSRSHMNDDTKAFIDSLKAADKAVEIVSKGSSLKFCLVAEGRADIYPRFAPTMEWDTAAGHAICKAVGLQVISRETNQELSYNKSNLLNSHFVVKRK